jgi:F420H(2)-dependent quinone reductase
MSAQVRQATTPPPRLFLRTAWILHRAVYRVSRGRIGLRPPAPGSGFGMMRLTTTGRTSGRARVTIVGYFEDGPSLVSLAMNGWGKADPAWWLNLQAKPDATVELVDGWRAVRGRQALGVERDRLWRKVGEYPGWGDDIDALAGRRSRETAVVVFEPRAVAQGAR